MQKMQINKERQFSQSYCLLNITNKYTTIDPVWKIYGISSQKVSQYIQLMNIMPQSK